MTATGHEMRLLVTGVDARGRSCVVGEEVVALDAAPTRSGLWFGRLFETASAPPESRPAGRGEHLELGLAPGVVRWQVVDYPGGRSYPMHHTDTVDLDIVLDGSIVLTLDDGGHELRPGDGAVINGVDHAWAAGADGARLSVIYIGTPPPE